MKPLPFPYGIAAELWLFGPPAKKQTIFHLFVMMTLFGSGTATFLILNGKIGRAGALVAAVPLGLAAGYGVWWLFAQALPLLHWLVRRGLVQRPDEDKFRKRIIWTACWKEPEQTE